MTTSVTKNSFAAGEWSPELCERYELERHNIACRLMKNVILHPLGYAYNRGGTYYVGTTKDSSKASRVIPFQFNVDDSYALEFGNLYMRVIRNGAYVMDGDSPYEVVTPYLEADLFELNFKQSGDYIYITHPSYAIKTLTRADHDDWTLGNYVTGASISQPGSFTRSSGSGTGNNYTVTAVGEDGEESRMATEVTNNGPGDTWTWAAVSGAEYYNFYKDPNLSGFYGWIGRATEETFTEPSAGIDPDYTKDPPQRATPPFNSENNYPSCTEIFQQRLLLSGSNNEPDTIFGSIVGFFNNHNYYLASPDDGAYDFPLFQSQINRIRWMVELKDLIIGTAGAELVMSNAPGRGAVTATSVVITRQSNFGVANIPPIIVGGQILFVEGSKKMVRDLSRAIDLEGNEIFEGNDLTILAKHLFEPYTIVDWTYERNPIPVIWCVLSNGTLVGLTYLKEQSVLAWHQHNTDGYFESVCSVLDTNGISQTYFVVRRTIDGSTKRFIEMWEDRLPYDDDYVKDLEDAFFVDSGLTYDSTPATTISGLDHLEGETVSVLADGKVIVGKTVSSGSITLDVAASKVHVGLPYTSELETTDFVFDTKYGNTADKIKKTSSVLLKVKNTKYLQIGPDENNLQSVTFDDLEADEKEIYLHSREDLRKNSIYIKSDQPLPFTIISLIARTDAGNR